VIAKPPFEIGAVQFMTTLLPEIVVVGVPGTEGTVAGNIAPLPTEEYSE